MRALDPRDDDGIGVWTCSRLSFGRQSLDAAIRNAQAPKTSLRSRGTDAPHLRKVCFNGRTAGRFAPGDRRSGE